MFKYLDNLRKKPESHRKMVAFLMSFSFVGVIFVVWLSIIYPDIKNTGQKRLNVRSNEPGAISSFMGNISEGFRSMGESFSGLNQSFGAFNDFMNNSDYYLASSTETSGQASTTPDMEIDNEVIDENSTTTDSNLNNE